MEENHQEVTAQSSKSQEGYEIRIMMPLAEENTRKLYEASKIGSIQTLKTLIEEDKDMVQNALMFCSNDIENPLHVSVMHGHLEFTRLLLAYNPELAAEVNALQQTPLHLASQNGDVEMARVLVEKNTSACLVRDFNGLIPLHHAVIRGHVQIVKELIRARPRSVWTKLKNGQTVLHLCVEDNHLEVMKLLIQIFLCHDEDFLDITDDSGNTILDMSLKLRRFEMLEYLLSIPKGKWGNGSMDEDEKAPKVRKRSKKLGSIEQSKRRGESKKKARVGWWEVWKKNLRYKGNWLQEVQGTLMLVATVIATVTFQGTINPPGGTWQQDQVLSSCSWKQGSVQDAGTAIMACKSLRIYIRYFMSNSISFLASVSVILLIVSGFPLKNKVFCGLLTVAMCVAVVCLTFAYVYGTAMVCGSKTAQSYLLVLLRICSPWIHLAEMAPLGMLIVPELPVGHSP
ncbi:ankyrin repeat-containing protein BDA1-like [Benincasa hispida]|uniref:ankyrin repeat-containing protein BDA1-like n=1 Tax=Benincasa hispida TaxID=102211 RepID=UPI0018FFA166|nr:ankyrin repeat-containing protein BDA1-like [Benincasa hispida]